jgi:H+/Cl- antiporter ClcA
MPQEKNIPVFVRLELGEIYTSSVRAALRQFRVLLLGLGIVTALLGVLLLTAVFHPRPGSDWYEMMHRTSPLPWLIMAVCIMVFLVPLLTAWKLMQDPRIRNGCHYSFSDSGMEFENSSTRATVNWTGFVRAEESRTSFLLFTNKVAAHILPKLCFASETDIVSLRQLLRNNIAKSKMQSG